MDRAYDAIASAKVAGRRKTFFISSYDISATSREITAMFDWAVLLRDYDGRRLSSDQCTPDEASRIFRRWYPTYRPRLAPYFSMVKMVLELIASKSPVPVYGYSDLQTIDVGPGLA